MLRKYAKTLQNLGDRYFAERANDLFDLEKRLLRHLAGRAARRTDAADGPGAGAGPQSDSQRNGQPRQEIRPGICHRSGGQEQSHGDSGRGARTAGRGRGRVVSVRCFRGRIDHHRRRPGNGHHRPRRRDAGKLPRRRAEDAHGRRQTQLAGALAFRNAGRRADPHLRQHRISRRGRPLRRTRGRGNRPLPHRVPVSRERSGTDRRGAVRRLHPGPARPFRPARS